MKKKVIIIAFIVLLMILAVCLKLGTGKTDEKKSMITVWNIEKDEEEINLPVWGAVDVLVDWGDGTPIEKITSELPAHKYTSSGTYEIKVKGKCDMWGKFDLVTLVDDEKEAKMKKYKECISEVKQFGELGVKGYYFANCSNLAIVSGENLVTENTFENVTDMTGMFFDCTKLENVDTSKFDTSKVISTAYMFFDCCNLEGLDCSNFNTDNLETMEVMFAYCEKIKELDLRSFNTSKVKNMDRLFFGCTNLEKLQLNNLDTSNIESIELMFYGCDKLDLNNISGIDMTKVDKVEQNVT
jgi:surface protein